MAIYAVLNISTLGGILHNRIWLKKNDQQLSVPLPYDRQLHMPNIRQNVAANVAKYTNVYRSSATYFYHNLSYC